MTNDRRRLVIDGYQAIQPQRTVDRDRPGEATGTRGYQASAPRPGQPSSAPPKFPNVQSAVHPPKKS
jgi:hypothetical protein